MVKLLIGDCRDLLKTLPSGSVHCCVTSPPYFGLRDYVHAAQIGLEQTPDEYVAEMVGVFREVRRVLRDDGTLWLNLGDSYAATTKGSSGVGKNATNKGTLIADRSWQVPPGLKAKDLIGIPWRVAFALQADGWWLRSDIIWHKPNPMPESVTDRPTKAHEYIFLLSKSARYYYDADAVAEACESEPQTRDRSCEGYSVALGDGRERFSKGARTYGVDGTRNRRSVWTVNTQPYSGAHFATFPQKLIEPCILAGCPGKCCPKCGMGWYRVTETINLGRTKKTSTGQDCEEGTKGHDGNTIINTLGFRAACSCNEMGCGSIDDPAYYPYDPIPGTVLDPFGGSGTTGAVASANGRSAILIELNSKYTELVNDRCGLFLSKD